MKVIKVPSGLRWVAAALFLTVPISALQAALISRAPWWRLPVQTVATATGITFVLSAIVGIAATQGWRWSVRLAATWGGVWVLLSAWVALRMAYPAEGFFTLFLGVFFALYVTWQRGEMGRSYFEPQIIPLSWYHGLPKSIPGLKCELIRESDKLDFEVSRMDREGAFVFAKNMNDKSAFEVFKAGMKVAVIFNFRGREVRCEGFPIRTLRRGTGRLGAGLRFCALSPDRRKELGDFVESIRGEGYVD